MERLIKITPLSFLFSDSSTPWWGSVMATVRLSLALRCFCICLCGFSQQLCGLVGIMNPCGWRNTEALKGELFCPGSFGEEVAGLGLIPCLSGSRFCLLSAKPCCLSAKKKDVGFGTGRGFFSALPLSAEGLLKGNMWAPKSQEMWKAQEMRGALFSCILTCGVAVGVGPGLLCCVGKAKTARESPREKVLGDKKLISWSALPVQCWLPEGKQGPYGILMGEVDATSSAAGRVEGKP